MRRHEGRRGTGTSALAALAVVAIVTVVELHGRGGRTVLDTAQAKSAASSSLTVYDSAVGRSVLEAEREVDTLFVQLSKAQTHLNHLANKVLEGAKLGKPSKLARPLAATKLHQSAHVVHVEEALDQSIAQAKANVDRLSRALRDAEAKLNTRVAFIVDAHPADRKKPPAGVQGPPIALAHKARASQLAEQPSVAASGDKAGFPSHAAERRHVRAAYRKFFKLQEAKEDAAKAKEAKEASEGVDVTPYSDCKGTACHVQIYMNLQTPTVDYTALTGKHYLPSLRKLRQTVRERGRLSLEDTRQAVEKKPNEQPYKFEWQRPGAEHVEIGGQKKNGKRSGVRTDIRAHDKRLKTHDGMEFDERPLGASYGALAEKSKIAEMKQLMRNIMTLSSGSVAAAGLASKGKKEGEEGAQLLSGKDVVPAVVELAREQAALVGLARRIESVADNRKAAAVQEDQLVHDTLSRLMGGGAASSAAPAAMQPLSQLGDGDSVSPALVRVVGLGAAAGIGAGVQAEAMWRARQAGSQQALESAAMKVGRSFLSFLPPKKAEEDLDLFTAKTDPALEPILQAAGVAHPSPFSVPGSRGAAQPEKPVLGNTLLALNGRVAQLEGSLEQSLGLLKPQDQSRIVAKLSKLLGQSTTPAQEPAEAMRGDAAEAMDAELRGARGRSARAPLSREGAEWMKSQEDSATAAADARVLSHLEERNKAVTAAHKSMSEEASRSRGAAAVSNGTNRAAAVAARLRAIAAADAEKAHELERKLRQGEAAARGAAALHKLGALRKLERKQRLSVARMEKAVQLGSVSPLGASRVAASGSAETEVVSGDAGDSAVRQSESRFEKQALANAAREIGVPKGVLARRVRARLAEQAPSAEELQAIGATLAQSAAEKLSNELAAGTLISGKSLSAEKHLASTLAEEVREQLNSLPAHSPAKAKLEGELRQVEEGLAK